MTIKRHLHTLAVIASLCCTDLALAIPARPTPFVFTQPDGTLLTVRLVGDEHAHCYLAEDGAILARKGDALYLAKISDEGLIEPSPYLAKPSDCRSATEKIFLQQVNREKAFHAMSKRAKSHAPSRMPALPSNADDDVRYGLSPGVAYPAHGVQKGIVVLVQYSDESFTIDNPSDYFNRMVNEEGFSDNGSTGSVRDYFIASSNGIFLPEWDVYGPVTLPKKRSYYGENDMWGNDKRAHEMAIHACNILDDEVDFSQYDCDGDGKIDNIYIIYAGQGEATGGASSTVWPHSWDVSEAVNTAYKYDGKRLDHYACSNELDGSKPDNIGAFCHEFSHVLGLPDLYATDYSSAYTPGAWSILDVGSYNNDSRTPPTYSAFERYALGWMDPYVIDSAMSIELSVISDNVACMVKTADPKEYFLFENRQNEGWDTYLPGHGMLVWHILYDASKWEYNEVNNSATKQYVDIEEADGSKSEWTADGDAFPGTSNVTEFTDTTNPNMLTWGKKSLGLPLTNIAETDGIISFDVAGGGQLVVITAEDPVEPEPTIEQQKPVMLEPSDITAHSFTLNWEEMELAHDYLITISAYSNSEESHDEIIDFADGVNNLPEGWKTTSSIAFTDPVKCGAAAPAMRFAVKGYIQSPEYDTDVMALEFWCKGIKCDPSNQVAVMAYSDNEWIETLLCDISDSDYGQIHSLCFDPGVKAVRIEYREKVHAGSMALDDIKVTIGSVASLSPIDGFDSVSVGDVTSFVVNDLEPNTTYYVTIQATDGTAMSQMSDTIAVTTAEEAGITTPYSQCNKPEIRIANGAVLVSGLKTVEIYSIDGRTAYHGGTDTWIKLAPGAYIVRGVGKVIIL